jgi:DNA polymerase-3 subunit gamma/tau
MVSQSAQVAGVEAGVLRLAFDNAALAARFSSGEHPENVALAVRETLGLHVRVEGVAGPGAETGTLPVQSPVTASVPVVKETPASTRGHLAAVPDPKPGPQPSSADDQHDIEPDDEPAPSAELSGAEAVAKLLGGTVVDD